MLMDSRKTTHRSRRALKGLRRGDLESLDHVWHAYSRRIYGFFYRMCWNPAEAAALTEETFAVLWRGALLLPDDGVLDIMLYRLARNVYLANQGEGEASDGGESASGEAENQEARWSSRLPKAEPVAPAQGKRGRDLAIASALFDLDADSHIVFVLLVFQGLTPDHVAEVTGLSKDTVLNLAVAAEARVRAGLGTALVAGVPESSAGSKGN